MLPEEASMLLATVRDGEIRFGVLGCARQGVARGSRPIVADLHAPLTRLVTRAAKNGGMTLRDGGPQIQPFDTQAGREPALEVANVVAVEHGATHLQERIGAP